MLLLQFVPLLLTPLQCLKVASTHRVGLLALLALRLAQMLLLCHLLMQQQALLRPAARGRVQPNMMAVRKRMLRTQQQQLLLLLMPM